MDYFVKTFHVEDGEVFSFDHRDLVDYLPDGWEIKGGAKPIVSFSPQSVTIAIEVFHR